ncbi:hypothetical protein J3P77_08940 [Pseudomonas sp. R1-18]|uniref:hypothetical protein n=1 Tax=Pseudomonas sp. R1-18 TaxID=1632772 RepID=UPI003DA87BFD
MERLTAASLLQWLREKPRSLGWNAIVAYDRSHANVALIQEYISRFAATSYLRPITARVEMSEEEAQHLYGFTLDCPRLSFENATVKWSLARLLVRVVGGTQLTTRKPPGGIDQVVKVSSYDAVNGPDITMGLSLAVLLGSVDVQGRVVIDLSKGTEIDVNFADSRDHRRIGGEFFRAYFEGLPDEQKVFVLSEIASSEGQALKPHNVQIRTHAPPGANEPGSTDYGLGAVLMFVTMEGEKYGTFPENDADLPYLIPADDAQGLSSTLLMGNDFLMRKFIEEGCRRLADNSEAVTFQTQIDSRGFITGMSATGGERPGRPISAGLAHFPSITCALRAPLACEGADRASFELTIEQEILVVAWQGYVNLPIALQTEHNSVYTKDVGQAWNWRGTFALQVDAQSSALRWAAVPELEVMQCKISPLEFADISEVASHFGEVASYLESELASHLRGSAQDFVRPLEDLDVFRLNSILFRDRYLFEPVGAHLPGDLCVPGRIAPGANGFVVSPVEAMVGPGERLQLTTVPAVTGVSWRVESVAGSSKNAGVIDPSSGLYTAPAVQDVQGAFSRVRVTATRGDHSSSALITVVLRDVTFNPLVVVCGVGMKTEMSAAARDGSQLQWSLGGGVAGSQILASTEPGGDHTYVAPQPSTEPATQAFSLDEVHVQRSGQAARYTSYVLVVHKPPTAIISIQPDADLPEGSVRLVADLGEGVIESGAVWTLLAGNGRLDPETGIYTTDPVGQHRFALITARVEPPVPAFPAFEGYLIIPLPLTLALAQHYSAGASS